MKPVSVLYIITDSGIGGTEKMLAELITRLDRSAFEPALVVLKKPGATAQELSEKGVPVFSLGLPARVNLVYILSLPLAFLRLLRIIRKRRPRIVHSFLFQANMLGRLAARAAGVPVNISSIRVMELERKSHAPLDRFSAGLVTCYTAVSEEVKNFTVRTLDLPVVKVVTIPNGIDLMPFHDNDPEKVRKEFNLAADAPLVGMVGRLNIQKGQDVLLKAMPELLKHAPDLHCLIVGDGPERESLEGLAQSLGVAERVIFAGERNDVPEILAALDVFVLPSRWEGMPNAVLEAMAASKPVVASSVGGCLDLVSQGKTGVLVPPEEPETLARAVAGLLDDPEAARSMGQAGRSRVESEFTMPSMVERNQQLYAQLPDTA